eukprot:scaffold37764_cov27-Tisochrysis_lutea.AAC.1
MIRPQNAQAYGYHRGVPGRFFDPSFGHGRFRVVPPWMVFSCAIDLCSRCALSCCVLLTAMRAWPGRCLDPCDRPLKSVSLSVGSTTKHAADAYVLSNVPRLAIGGTFI